MTELEALDHFLANGRLPTSATLAAKPKDDNEGLKDLLLKDLEGMTVDDFAEACGIRDVLSVENIRELGIEMMVTLFCECDINNSKLFRNEMKSFDVNAADAMKMFLYFNKLRKTGVREIGFVKFF